MQTKYLKMSFEEFLRVNGRAICLKENLFKDLRNHSVPLLLCLFPDLPDEFGFYRDFDDLTVKIGIVKKEKNIIVPEASWELWKPLGNNYLEYSFKTYMSNKETINECLFNPATELFNQMKEYYTVHFGQDIIIKPFE